MQDRPPEADLQDQPAKKHGGSCSIILPLQLAELAGSSLRDSLNKLFASPVKYKNSCIFNQNNLVVKLISLVYHKSFFYLTGRACFEIFEKQSDIEDPAFS